LRFPCRGEVAYKPAWAHRAPGPWRAPGGTGAIGGTVRKTDSSTGQFRLPRAAARSGRCRAACNRRLLWRAADRAAARFKTRLPPGAPQRESPMTADLRRPAGP
jgi:uncharacterized protein (DUF2126 family)